jgi:hypothetical protein
MLAVILSAPAKRSGDGALGQTCENGGENPLLTLLITETSFSQTRLTVVIEFGIIG